MHLGAGVRDRYPSTSKHGRRGILDFYGPPPSPALPTQALPGSAEKVAVIEARAQSRERDRPGPAFGMN